MNCSQAYTRVAARGGGRGRGAGGWGRGGDVGDRSPSYEENDSLSLLSAKHRSQSHNFCQSLAENSPFLEFEDVDHLMINRWDLAFGEKKQNIFCIYSPIITVKL